MTTSTGPAEIHPTRPRHTGRTALTMAVLVIALSLLASLGIGILAAPYAIHRGGGVSVMLHATADDPQQTLVFLASMLHVLAGTAFGISAFVLGIIATTTGRGRRAGIWAIVIAAIAPIVSLVLYFSVALSLSH